MSVSDEEIYTPFTSKITLHVGPGESLALGSREGQNGLQIEITIVHERDHMTVGDNFTLRSAFKAPSHAFSFVDSSTINTAHDDYHGAAH